MFELKTSASFDSAHFLSGYQGKCSNLHGHRWKIEVTVGMENLQEEGNCRGMAMLSMHCGNWQKAMIMH